jgi:outer membrane protein
MRSPLPNLFSVVFTAFVVVTAGPGPAYAEPEPTHWEIGAGAAVRPDYEGSEDYEFVPVGTFRVTLDREAFVEFTGAKGSGRAAQLRVNVVSDALVQFGPVLEFRFGRNDVDNNQVDAMNKIDPALELGGFFGFDEQGWFGGITVLADISDSYNGVFADGTLGYRYSFPWVTVGGDVVVTWGSDGYMETYFGVGSDDAGRSGLDEYEADSDFKDVGGELFARVDIPGIEGLGLMGVFAYNRLIKDAADSPIVEDVGSENQLFGGLMLVYGR